MRYCRVNTVPPIMVIRRDDAQALADKASTDWEYVEVPTGKAELMEYINTIELKASLARPEPALPSLSSICMGVRQLEAHQLAQVAHALGRRVTDLT